jgi:hypothetical protein
MQFWTSLSLAAGVTILVYSVLVWVLRFFSIPIL